MPKILVADDNSNIQKMVTLALKGEGIDVVSVGNGEAAVRRIAEISPDLVLADIFMPVRNGYEVCEFVKHDPRFAHVPVVLLVGAFDPLDEHEAERVGADGVLKKPFVPPDPLITLVKGLLAKSASEHPVPVAVPEIVPAPVGAAIAATPAPAASAEGHPVSSLGVSTSAPAAEEPAEDFAVHPAPIAFREGDKPIAWGDLLSSPSAEAEPTTPHASTTTFGGAGLGELRFWPGAAATEEPAAEPGHASLPAAGEDSNRPGHDPLPWGTVTEIPKPAAPAGAPSHAEALHSPGFLDESLFTPQPISGSTPLPAGPPEKAPQPAWNEYEHPALNLDVVPSPLKPTAAMPGTTSLRDVSPLVPEAEKDLHPGAFVAEASAAMQSPAHQEEETPVSLYSAEVNDSGLSRSAGGETAAGDAQSADPAIVEALVAKVLEKMQPQILEIVTREILKPVAEALVRMELQKR